MYHVIGLKQTRGIKNVALKAAKKFVGAAVYWEESRAIISGVDDHYQIGHFRVLMCKAFYIKMSSACSFIVMHEWRHKETLKQALSLLVILLREYTKDQIRSLIYVFPL